MTFQDFINEASSESFLMTEARPREHFYTFVNENRSETITARLLPSLILNDSVPNWEVDINGDKVEFANPAEQNSMEFVVSSLCYGSLDRAVKLAKAINSGA